MKKDQTKSSFSYRHIGSTESEIQHKLKTLSCNSLNELIQKTAPKEILNCASLDLPAPLSEAVALKQLKILSQKNKIFKNYIGQGYYETQMPAVIQRNVLENPQWLTSYTPYQSEISQGRLEALLNFQTMIQELTEMEVANASLLDEGTATAEAISVAFNNREHESAKTVFIDQNLFLQTQEVVKTRAQSAGLVLLKGDIKKLYRSGFKWPSVKTSLEQGHNIFCAVVQYPDSEGGLYDWTAFCKKAKEKNIITIFIADPLSLCLFKTPGAMGGDMVVGSVQRLGLSLSFGGPHAGYIATREKYVRSLPGRIVGVSKDRLGKTALRLAIQTREQHIRKEKATSNICTAQALLAVLAGMFALYHGPEGLRKKALHIHSLVQYLCQILIDMGFQVRHSKNFFDTVQVLLPQTVAYQIYHKLLQNQINALLLPLSVEEDDIISTESQSLIGSASIVSPPTRRSRSEMKVASIFPARVACPPTRRVSFSINETNSLEDIREIVSLFQEYANNKDILEKKEKIPLKVGMTAEEEREIEDKVVLNCDPSLVRQTPCLRHPVFKKYHSETKMLRYIHHLQEGDLSLTHSMIPLGSCTMKLNGTAELLPLSWPQLTHIHPFAPSDQTIAYLEMIKDLEKYLCEITGFKAISFQPNAGSQGEYAGLLMIRRYHAEKKQQKRNICLIPSSAHGTNFASAVMAGLKPVTVACDKNGSISSLDLKQKITQFKPVLSCFMLTYPSTFGFFEEGVPQICEAVHKAGGLVYLDGANMNSLVGLSRVGDLGADLCHLNLHKTFCIPHGGGGPGLGPVAVSSQLVQFLPQHPFGFSSPKGISAISSAPFGSAGLIAVSYMYIRLMGAKALTKATKVAILNANYVAKKLKNHYKILYAGRGGFVAHECIIDFRKFKHSAEITVEDVAKRLIDYGFHAPTMNWPVVGTLMAEPTESEDKAELDRFCSALIEIRNEIKEVEEKKYDTKNNVLKNAPHVIEDMVGEWSFPYSREKAFYPLSWVREHKFWPKVSRVQNSYGDINLFCSCPPPPSSEK